MYFPQVEKFGNLRRCFLVPTTGTYTLTYLFQLFLVEIVLLQFFSGTALYSDTFDCTTGLWSNMDNGFHTGNIFQLFKCILV